MRKLPVPLPNISYRQTIKLALILAVIVFMLTSTTAFAGDVYSNISPAPQLPSSGLVERYPLVHYQLDQYFSAISFGLTSGVDTSGVFPGTACFLAQIIWLITAFLANAVITVFALAFNLDLINGDGTPGSGALQPISVAMHNLYAHTLGTPWLVAAIVLAGCWAMWRALIQRRYAETAGALALSLLYCVLAIGIVTQPERTIGPASKLSNEISASLLSLTDQGNISNEQEAKTVASNQLFSLLILNPWTVLEFGGLEHCTKTIDGKTHSVAVRPLSSNPTQDTRLSEQLENGVEISSEDKTCINNRNKYARHFLAYAPQSSGRNSEYKALELGDTKDLPNSDPSKQTGTYKLGVADKSAAEASGKGGQYQRLLLSLVIAIGELGAFLLLGALTVGMIVAQIFLLGFLMTAPVALLAGIFPGRGHHFFRVWATKLAGFLARKVIYSLILAVILAVCQALNDATSNLGWLLAFVLQAAFLWTAFLQRNRLLGEIAGIPGPRTVQDAASRLQSLYYTTRLTRAAGLLRQNPPVTTTGRGGTPKPSVSPSSHTSTSTFPPAESPAAKAPVPNQPSDPPNEDTQTEETAE